MTDFEKDYGINNLNPVGISDFEKDYSININKEPTLTTKPLGSRITQEQIDTAIAVPTKVFTPIVEQGIKDVKSMGMGALGQVGSFLASIPANIAEAVGVDAPDIRKSQQYWQDIVTKSNKELDKTYGNAQWAKDIGYAMANPIAGVGTSVKAITGTSGILTALSKAGEDRTEEGIKLNDVKDVANAMSAGAVTGKAFEVIGGYLAGAKKNNISDQYNTLIKDLGLTRSQADEIVAKTETLSGKEIKTTADKMFTIAESQPTQKSTGNILNAVAKDNPEVARMIHSRAKERASSIKGKIADSKDALIGVKKDFADYTTNVNKQYDLVGNAGNEIAKDYRFTFGETDMPSIVQRMDELTGVNMGSQFGGMLKKWLPKSEARNLNPSDLTKQYSFSDLLNLRRDVGSFWTKNKSKLVGDDYTMMQKAMNSIDDQIDNSMKNIGGGKEWLDEFSKAKASYSEMKDLTETSIIDALNKAGNIKNEKVVKKVIDKFLTSDVDDVSTIMGKLTPATRDKVEGKIIENMISDEAEGIDYVGLANKMNQYEFSTEKGKIVHGLVNDFSKVFKNDVALSKMSPTYGKESDGMIFAETLYGKAKMAFVNKTWKMISQKLKRSVNPSEEARLMRANAIDTLEDLLANPQGKSIGDIDYLVSQLGIESAQAQKEARTSLFGILKRIQKGRKDFVSKKPSNVASKVETTVNTDITKKIGSTKKKPFNALMEAKKNASEVPIGGSEDEARQAVINLSKKPLGTDTRFKNMSKSAIAEVQLQKEIDNDVREAMDMFGGSYEEALSAVLKERGLR